MDTKYGTLSPVLFNEYCTNLRNRVWQLLPLKQEQCPTINNNIERINREILGIAEIIEYTQCKSQLMTVTGLLEHLMHEDNFKLYRSDVLRCCRLINDLIDIVKKTGDKNV